MLTSTRHHSRPALVALAALAGLLLAPAGASAACGAMKSAGSCPPSMAACCCSKPPSEADASAQVRTGPEVARTAAFTQEVCPTAGTCSCEGRPEVPAGPARGPARLADDGRADRGGALAIEIPDLRPSPCPAGSSPPPTAGPPHVPLYLRNARFLI